jgi:hypothetical protein
MKQSFLILKVAIVAIAFVLTSCSEDNLLGLSKSCTIEGTVKKTECGFIIETRNGETIYPPETGLFTFKDGQKVRFGYEKTDCCVHSCFENYRDPRCITITCIKQIKEFSSDYKEPLTVL